MIFGYARVTTTDQNPDLPFDALKQAGFDRLFVDKASGARADRPQFCKMLEQVWAGDVILTWKLDRLGRSLRHLLEVVDRLNEQKIGLKSLTDPIDTTTSQGKLIFNIFAALAEFERDLIRERKHTITQICETHQICWASVYKYLRHEGVQIGRDEPRQSSTP